MIVVVDAAGAVTLESPEDFGRFHVELRGASADLARAALRDHAVGRLESATEAFITVSGLETVAGPRADAAWRANLEKMLAYAKKKGWWDEATQSIAAHVDAR